MDARINQVVLSAAAYSASLLGCRHSPTQFRRSEAIVPAWDSATAETTVSGTVVPRLCANPLDG